jgi:hypothetical protein
MGAGENTAHSRRRTTLGSWRERAVTVFAGLDLPASFVIDDLHRAVERVRGRPIVIESRVIPAVRLHGVWIAGPSQDFVFHHAHTAPVHRSAILAHEFWHILNNDSPEDGELRRVASRLLPDIDPAMIERVAGRSIFTDEVEQRAELFATIAIAALGPRNARNRPAHREVQQRITSTLGTGLDG